MKKREKFLFIARNAEASLRLLPIIIAIAIEPRKHALAGAHSNPSRNDYI
jgi:hypothetical protein